MKRKQLDSLVPAFEETVLEALGDYREGDMFLAAVSGGADSTAMLVSLTNLRDRAAGGGEGRQFSLRCIHVEHGIRPEEESLGDAEAVKALCKTLNIPCKVTHIPRGLVLKAAGAGGPGVEGAARHFRRRILLGEARRLGAAKILIAHTGDDLLENILLGLLRGAGPGGLRPMPRERGLLLRPLLARSRADTEAYLAALGFSWRTDSSNQDLRFLRNRVRLKLIPLLDECFPSWRSALRGMAETQGLAAAFIGEESARRLPWEKSPAGLALPWGDFLAAPEILREEALFQGADLLACGEERLRGKLAPARKTVRAFAGGGLKAADLGPVKISRRGDMLVLGKKASRPSHSPRGEEERGFALVIKEPGLYVLEGAALGGGPDLRLEVSALDKLPASLRGMEKRGFFASLPLVIRFSGDKTRRGDTLCLCAEDSWGIAAFVCITGEGVSVEQLFDKTLKN